MNNIILVYGSTKERANYKLEELLNNMKYGDVLNVMKSYNQFVVTMKNGDIYKSVTASDNARGHRWHYAYIDSSINSELIDCVILPKFVSNNSDRKLTDCVTWY